MKTKTLIKAILSISAISFILPFYATADGKVIYGQDDRIEYFQASAAVKTLADGVVSLWSSTDIEFNQQTKTYKLKTQNFGQAVNLCQQERFREQPIGAFCSGSLVGPDLVMTAGHCATSESKCKDTKFVFGFAIKKDGGTASDTIPAGEVYSCKKIVTRVQGAEENSSNVEAQNLGHNYPPVKGTVQTLNKIRAQDLGPDYALIQLDRPVAERKPLQINRNQNLKKGESMFVIGHPVGLPLKVAGGATVRDPSPKGYFVADLDTYGGNSGSPVFNTKTKLVEGILVRGETDFVTTPQGCRISNVVGQNAGRGEDVTKVSELASFIPQLKDTLVNYISDFSDFVSDTVSGAVSFITGSKQNPRFDGTTEIEKPQQDTEAVKDAIDSKFGTFSFD
ncbi:MAG: trypsin-like peptidase domain-containing protein [Elusimicrobia bacterium]|nr:trypsin-like peptidase domain-containing protein [Elusimicrobiota bacterium]